jgi:uncharacterized membrane protein
MGTQHHQASPLALLLGSAALAVVSCSGSSPHTAGSASSPAPSTVSVSCSQPRTLPDLGYGSAATSEDHQGTIVGFVRAADGNLHAAVWRDGHLQPQIPFKFPWSVASHVNDHGLVLGSAGRTADQIQAGWIWTGQRLSTLPLPSRTKLFQARRINERGDVVGTLQDPQGHWLAVRWSAPNYTPQILPPAAGDIGSFVHSLNDAAVGVGASYQSDDSPPSPVFWDRQGQAHALPALAGPAEAWVNNDAGDIAGTGSTSSDPSAPNHSHALFWDAQQRLHDLGELPNTNDTKAFGISKDSWVVGYSALSDANGQPQTSQAWVWPHEGPLVPLPTPTNQMSSAHDVIENGTILGQVGVDLDPHGRAAVWTCHAAH